MKTDSIFYRLFQEFPDIFFELIGNSPDVASLYQFSSVEIKQTAFRIDGVFVPTVENDHLIYFVEVQFQADERLYSRLFAEICLYLRQNQPLNDWGAVILYPSRSIDTGDIKHYQEFFISERVRRIYLDELIDATSLPISLATVKLIVTSEDTAIVEARKLIARTKSEINLPAKQKELLELIETILLYKLPTISKKELEEMFSLSELRNTRYFQDVFQEGERSGKLKAVPAMLAAGLTLEQVAQALDLSIEEVRQATQQQSSDSQSGN
ncbi:Rpn family recombination-promoting nuclease/putative transposase [Anabaena subtropica]|uniref:Rpn family recombination-promoting nuclease/putative transposase n=1 Tax=Anabaena subtropica FACHB-260 TaxID=2692884 RepID=A0ABR8CST2_9NOST|nr:Rpn family recombination-promoting nuclease/putative transposase [Anabaena subtropica]MBD2345237.1 Rpn family recombination-promoting nuclease/putative transposase [Anabaena subtropica FACHB-260]